MNLDQFIGVIELDNADSYTILKDDNGYKACLIFNAGYVELYSHYETLEELYEVLTSESNI